MDQLWQNIYDITNKIVASGVGKRSEVYGRELIGLAPEELILLGTKLPLSEGTIELTLATPAAYPTFEWVVEITIKEPANVEHYLLRPDKQIVEAYGKNVFDATTDRATKLKNRIDQISKETIVPEGG